MLISYQEDKFSDNIIVAYEIFHSLKSRKRQVSSYMDFKTDKAYIRQEWSFVKETAKKMDFGDQWIRLIMACISTVSYSVLINGYPCCFHFSPTKNLIRSKVISTVTWAGCLKHDIE